MPSVIDQLQANLGRAIRLELLGKPVPLSRTGHGQFGGKFLAAPSSQQIGQLVDAWQRAGSPRLPADVPLKLVVTFISERPKSHFGTGRNAGILKPSARPAPTSVPDLDNLVKLICDGLQGNAFDNDARIVAITAEKMYGSPARTLVELWPR